MLKMIKGVKINNTDILNEEYMVDDNWIIANINVDKILKVINEFVDMQKDSLFLIIEVPTNIDNEEIKDNKIYQIHKDVYYLDNISISFAKELLDSFGNLFINDGMAQIGIGNHLTGAEIITDKYNVVLIYNGRDDVEKYMNLLSKNKIKKVEKLITARDFFTESNPGECNCIIEGGKTVYDVVNILIKEAGLYFAERREN